MLQKRETKKLISTSATGFEPVHANVTNCLCERPTAAVVLICRLNHSATLTTYAEELNLNVSFSPLFCFSFPQYYSILHFEMAPRKLGTY